MAHVVSVDAGCVCSQTSGSLQVKSPYVTKFTFFHQEARILAKYICRGSTR